MEKQAVKLSGSDEYLNKGAGTMEKQALNRMEALLRAGKISPKNITRLLSHYAAKPGQAIPAAAELAGKGEKLKKIEPYLRGALTGGQAAMELAGPERVGKLLTSEPGLIAMRALRTPGIPREAPLIAQQHPELYHALTRVSEKGRPLSFKQLARMPLKEQYTLGGGLPAFLKAMQVKTLKATALRPDMSDALAGFMMPGILGRPLVYARGPGARRHEMAHYMTNKYPMGYNIRATKHILDTLREAFPKSEFGATMRSLAGEFGPQGKDIAQLGGLAEGMASRLKDSMNMGKGVDPEKALQMWKHTILSGGAPVPAEATAQWIATRGNPKSVQRFMKTYEPTMPKEIAQSTKLSPRMKVVAEHLRRNYGIDLRSGRGEGEGERLVGRKPYEGKTLEKLPGLIRGIQELYPREIEGATGALKELGAGLKKRLFGQ